MMKLSIILFSLIYFSAKCQEVKFEVESYESASEEVYADILTAENTFLIPYSNMWIRTETIVCLSQIWPKKIDHQYVGLSFQPTFDEIRRWKEWYEKYKSLISYSFEPDYYGSKTIVVEYQEGVYRSNDCIHF